MAHFRIVLLKNLPFYRTYSIIRTPKCSFFAYQGSMKRGVFINLLSRRFVSAFQIYDTGLSLNRCLISFPFFPSSLLLNCPVLFSMVTASRGLAPSLRSFVRLGS